MQSLEDARGVQGILKAVQSEESVSSPPNPSLVSYQICVLDWNYGRRTRPQPQKILVSNNYKFVLIRLNYLELSSVNSLLKIFLT